MYNIMSLYTYIYIGTFVSAYVSVAIEKHSAVMLN